MKFCKKCGAKLDDDAAFCPNCGQKSEIGKDEKSEPVTGDSAKKDTDENKIMSILSYISFLVLVPIFAGNQEESVRFHANQGLILFLCEIAWWVVEGILTAVFHLLFALNAFALYSVLAAILGFVNIIFLVLSIVGIINVVNDTKKELPFIGKYRILK